MPYYALHDRQSGVKLSSRNDAAKPLTGGSTQEQRADAFRGHFSKNNERKHFFLKKEAKTFANPGRGPGGWFCAIVACRYMKIRHSRAKARKSLKSLLASMDGTYIAGAELSCHFLREMNGG